MKVLLLTLVLLSSIYAVNPIGVHQVTWGTSAAELQSKAVPAVVDWKETTPKSIPKELPITAFTSKAQIAGYKAKTTYYFYNDKLFQATIHFDFNNLKNYDFNYNVFLSVDSYYREVRKQTLVFIDHIYALLEDKYGKKQPIFLPLDPKLVLMSTDNYLGQERWNHRYHPSEYYKRIIGTSYARWKYPKTEINFAVTISAADKRFDYTLSFLSTTLRREVEVAVKKQKSSGL